MAVPFISRDRRTDILSHLASSVSTDDAEDTADPEDTKLTYNKLYTKEQQKDQKDSKDSKDSKDDSDSHAPGGVSAGVDEVIRAARADAAATDDAGMSVGQKWMTPAKSEKCDPVV